MARPLRTHIPDVPLHIVQRGHNRAPCFFADADRLYYLALLRELLRKWDIALHAYVLMTNHVHLLLTPSTQAGVAHALMSVGGGYVRYINRKYVRSGTLWDGRYRSSLIQTEKYLFACQRYIELNPVRACMVADPADYRWSSYRCHAFGAHDMLVTPSASYLSLGDSASSRQTCGSSLDDCLLIGMRTVFERSRPLGDTEFVADIERRVGRICRVRPPGRPLE